MCHAAEPVYEGIVRPPKGVLLENDAEIAAHETGQAARCRPHESRFERKRDEAGDGYYLDRQITSREHIHVARRRVDEQAECIEQIDRPIWNNSPSKERNGAFPWVFR